MEKKKQEILLTGSQITVALVAIATYKAELPSDTAREKWERSNLEEVIKALERGKMELEKKE